MASKATAYRRVAPARLDLRETNFRSVIVSHALAAIPAPAPVAARLQCLSRFGCRLEASGDARLGDRVRVHFGEGPPVAATLMLRDGMMWGYRFDAPLDARRYRELSRATV